MASVRRDRPVHLLGIGGVSDIFHGVNELRRGVVTAAVVLFVLFFILMLRYVVV